MNFRWTGHGTQTVYTTEHMILFQKRSHISIKGFAPVSDEATCLFWDHDKFWFAHKTHKVSIRTTRCEEEPNRRSLEVDGLTKQSSEVMEQRATTGNAIVLHFYTFNWFLSLHCLYCSSLYRSELLCIEIATCKIVCPDIENTSRYLSKSYTCHPKIWQLTQQDTHLSLSMCIL